MNKLSSLKNIKLGRPSVGQILFWGAVALLAIGGFFFIRGLVTCWTITPLPGQPPSDCGTVTAGLSGPTLNEEGTPVAPAEELPPPLSNIPDSDLPPAWDGASRITVLLIGLDYRDWAAGEGAPRSDSMILLTIDPVANAPRTATRVRIGARYRVCAQSSHPGCRAASALRPRFDLAPLALLSTRFACKASENR